MYFFGIILLIAFNRAEPQTHDLQFVKRNGRTLPFFYPPVISFTYKKPSTLAQFSLASNEIAEIFGTAYLKAALGMREDQIHIANLVQSENGTYHIYANRLIDGIPVVNHNAAVHVVDGHVIAESASFLTNTIETISTPVVSVPLEEALKTAKEAFGAEKDDSPAKLVYIEIPNKKIVYAHSFQLKDLPKAFWAQVFVDAATGKIVHVVDYVSEATFNALKLPKISPLDGFSVDINPENPTASPKGWADASLTKGNNVDSLMFINGQAIRPEMTDDTFTTAFSPTLDPSAPENQKAAIVNSFYIANKLHDIVYQYGFDEEAGNFQASNFDKGGLENDDVLILNQQPGKNNAYFATPPDGTAPIMTLLRWAWTTPNRDSAMDNSIIIHEYTHGISTRLTGGKSNVNCLQSYEAAGLGEGWSDMFAFMFTQAGTETRKSSYPFASYVTGNSKNGLRDYPYSTTKNPLKYADISKQTGTHGVGTIWASMLHEVYWNLVDVYRFSPDWMKSKQLKGNIILLQILIGGMKLQPCSPTFLDARDAILAADNIYYGGKNKCFIWIGFAKRGLGVNALQGTNGSKIPPECKNVKIKPLNS